MRETKKFILILILVILAVYANSFRNEFVWDDEMLIVKNPSVASLRYAWTHFALDLYHSYSNYYRPVQMLTYMADFALWRLNPFGYHLTNVFLHICVSIFLFVLFRVLTGDARVGFAGSLFYAVHPAHTAVVTYIAGRADSLAALFMILSVLLLHRHFKAREGRSALLLLGASSAMFLFALLSKEAAVALPAVILFYRMFFIGDDELRRSRQRIRFHYISPFAVILGVYILLRLHALNFQENLFSQNAPVFYIRMLTSLKALGVYLGIVFFPIYMHMERSLPYAYSILEPDVLLAGVLCILMFLAVLRVRRISAPAFFGALFFIVSLLPVLNIYPMSCNLAEHWLSIPMIGMSLFLSSLGLRFWDDSKRIRPLLALFFACYLAFLSYQTFDRNFDWRSPRTIYTHTYVYSPKSVKMLNNLGNLYRREGDMRMALVLHRKAAVISPKDHKTILNIGLDYERMGMFEEALDKYKLSVRLKPNYAKGYFNIGNIYVNLGRPELAARAYEKAIRCDELYAKARVHLGNAYFETGRYEKAKAEYERAIEISPDMPFSYNGLGNVLSELGFYAESAEAYRKAIELSPTEEVSYYLNLGVAYGKMGRHNDSIRELERARQISPRDVKVLINLGAAYFYKGDTESAKKELRKALLVEPQNTLAARYLKSISESTP